MGTYGGSREGSPRTTRQRLARGAVWAGFFACVATLVAVPLIVARQRTPVDVGRRPEFAPSANASPAAAKPPRTGSADAVTVHPAVPPPAKPARQPVRLRVASLGIDAPIDPTGVQPDGTVVVPGDAYRVGWYRFSPAPGATQGSTVLVGHVDSRTQGRGALYPLRGAVVGARITVGLDGGTEVRYRVVSRESIVKGEMPWAQLFSLSGSPRLTVITCGGPYIKALGGYQDNVVVTAVPVEPDRDEQ